jgi:hypothetical protein
MALNVLRFWTEYRPDGVDDKGAPKLRSIDMVAYAPLGKSNMQTCVEAISRLSKVQPIDPGTDNPAVLMAHARWKIIKQHYDAWKQGNEVPVDGTPLGAWPALTPEQVQALKTMGLRTVEEIRDASEGIVTRFPFPNSREIQRQAGMFLAAFDKDKVSRDHAALQAQLDEKNEQLEELRQIVLEMQRNQAKPAKKDKEAA